MKNNYLLFIIDSLNYKHLKQAETNLMPFFSKLKKEGICCENMFAQAPYTEAALMNLYCGQSVLQNGGYLLRFKNAERTLFEEMKEAGYITYFNAYQPQCYPSSLRRGVDYIYYNVGFDQGALWSYRLEHYAKVLKENGLKEEEYLLLAEILTDNFEEWIRFLQALADQEESTNMISENASNYCVQDVRPLVDNEYETFKKNPKVYINELLNKGKEHIWFQIPAFCQNNKIKERRLISSYREELLPLFKQIRKKNVVKNLKNCKGICKGPIKKSYEMIKHPSKVAFKNLLKSIYLAVNEIIDLDLFDRISENLDSFKNAPSGRTHINHYLQWADEHKEEGAHFACIHIDDIHNPEVFFTYDTVDMELIREEKTVAQNLLEKLPDCYYGSITHDLSLRYADDLVCYLYKGLERHGLIENTRVIICADHGFSFSGNPLRDSFVNNFYLENYNIPCVIIGPGIIPKSITGLRASVDIPATICELATGKIPKSFSGQSLIKEYEYNELFIEYCGGGCPDLSRREINLAVFDNDYFVGTKCTLSTQFDNSSIVEVYDLRVDSEQKNKLNYKSLDACKVQELMKKIELRRLEIQGSFAEVCSDNR